jgi:hypothetical protein
VRADGRVCVGGVADHQNLDRLFRHRIHGATLNLGPMNSATSILGVKNLSKLP